MTTPMQSTPMSTYVDNRSRDMRIALQETVSRILIVDEDHSARRALHMALYDQGFDVTDAPSRKDAIAFTCVNRYDAVLLGVGTPEQDGIEVCRELRLHYPWLAILMLDVRGGQHGSVDALDAGADDYIVKPVHVRELTARIRAAVRRLRTTLPEANQTIQVGEISICSARRLAQKAGRAVHLTPKQFDLLHYLMRHSGLPLPHGRILASVWGPDHASQVEYLRVFVRQLRKKLEDEPTEPRYLLTDNRIGYRFVDPSHVECLRIFPDLAASGA